MPAQEQIRKLRHWKHADAGWFRDLDNRCFPVEESFVNTSAHHWWVLHIGAIPVAYAGLCLIPTTKRKPKKTALFVRCGVLPEYRGCGIQRMLIQARVAWCRSRGIERIETYTASQSLGSSTNLRRCGFTQRVPKDGLWRLFRLDLTK